MKGLNVQAVMVHLFSGKEIQYVVLILQSK